MRVSFLCCEIECRLKVVLSDNQWDYFIVVDLCLCGVSIRRSVFIREGAG